MNDPVLQNPKVIDTVALSRSERKEIAEILTRRANEVATYYGEHKDKFPGSVELALDRELKRLRNLRDRVAVPESTDDE